MKRRILIGIVALLCWNYTGAQSETKQWTLEQCIRYAVANNINLKQREQMQESKKIELNTQKFSWMPNLTAGGNQSFGFGRSESRDGLIVDQNGANTSLEIRTDMPLFDGFRIPNNIAAGKLNLKAATEALNKAKEDLAIGVTSYYLMVLFNKELLNIAELQLNQTKDQVTVTEALVEVGKVAMSQLYDIKAQLASDEVKRTDAENNFNLALLDLIQALELERLGADFDIAQPDLSDVISDNIQSLLSPDLIYDNAVGFKPQIKEQEYLLERQKKLLRVAMSNFYPQININASYSSSYDRRFGSGIGELDQATFSEQFKANARRRIGISLSIPIFNRFANLNRIRQAKVDIVNQALTMENAKKTLYKEIQKAYFDATAAHANYIASEKSVAASEEAFMYAEERYAAGKFTVFEYNASKTKYAQSLSQQAQAKYNFIFSAKILDFYNGIEIRL
ncbi:MAG: TolC family protein [Tannerella sp.]|jgi:outer membrane protein|nr:TolC family protein [Tannerella sp.]